jgi:hypothetical protein
MVFGLVWAMVIDHAVDPLAQSAAISDHALQTFLRFYREAIHDTQIAGGASVRITQIHSLTLRNVLK